LNYLCLELYKIKLFGKLEKLNINYFNGTSVNNLFNPLQDGTIVIYPDSIILKELTRQEVSRFKKNALY
jgi:hypothetical protein